MIIQGMLIGHLESISLVENSVNNLCVACVSHFLIVVMIPSSMWKYSIGFVGFHAMYAYTVFTMTGRLTEQQKITIFDALSMSLATIYFMEK